VLDERLLYMLAAVLLVGLVTVGLHDRHYRRRRDVVRDARLRALEGEVPEGRRGVLLEARVAAIESILLEDETT